MKVKSLGVMISSIEEEKTNKSGAFSITIGREVFQFMTSP